MQQVHGTHGTTGVVEDPLLVEVDVACSAAVAAEVRERRGAARRNQRTRVALVQLGGDLVHDRANIVGVRLQGRLGDLVQHGGLEDVLRLHTRTRGASVAKPHSLRHRHTAAPPHRHTRTHLMAKSKEERQAADEHDQQEELVGEETHETQQQQARAGGQQKSGRAARESELA